jgi:hypothetical protein
MDYYDLLFRLKNVETIFIESYNIPMTENYNVIVEIMNLLLRERKKLKKLVIVPVITDLKFASATASAFYRLGSQVAEFEAYFQFNFDPSTSSLWKNMQRLPQIKITHTVREWGYKLSRHNILTRNIRTLQYG